MMSVGTGFVIICPEIIPKKDDWNQLKEEFIKSRLEVVEISTDQMGKFCGNVIEVCLG